MDRFNSGSPGRLARSTLWQRLGFSLLAATVALFVGKQLIPGFFLFSFGSPQAMLSQPLPQFTERSSSRWFNSKPLRVEDLRGKVVFLDVWTFG